MALILILVGAANLTAADNPPINYDESKVPPYTLPDPLQTESGETVTTAEQWRATRRGEIVELFQTHMYGRSPGRPADIHFETLETGEALDGKAIRKQVRVYFKQGTDEPWMDILVYLPKSEEPVPLFVGMNFNGNHAIGNDPAVPISAKWMR
ncbi:MAG: (4-O-methyl)-D-glucuronate---lignin esterase, partial [Candidatus Hydrogenedentes bacterium]|nr:(4-O-methyl)-D-glucuronate---lignin esterase [Candidatus Hydrogenedentota bacterium]